MDQEQRDKLLKRAVAAIHAYEKCGPGTDPGEARRLAERAEVAVTTAVVEGGWLHTQITPQVGSSGLGVVGFIRSPEARARALSVEYKAAENYLALVRDARIGYAAGQATVQVDEYGYKSKLARWFGVTRVTLDAWLEKSRAN